MSVMLAMLQYMHVYHGALRFIANLKALTSIALCMLGLDGLPCPPVDLTIGIFLFIRLFLDCFLLTFASTSNKNVWEVLTIPKVRSELGKSVESAAILLESSGAGL